MRAVSILLAGLAVSLLIIALRWTLYRGCAQDSNDLTTPGSAVAAHLSQETAQALSSRVSGTGPERAVSLPKPLQPGQAVPDAVLVDQDAREFRLSDLKGHVVVLAFVYTHCNVTSMCPLATAKLVEAQRLVKERGLSGVRFLLVSFDTERDRPQRLKEFAALYGPELSTFTFATGDAKEVAHLSQTLNTYYRQSVRGVFEHNIVVSLLDQEGILRDDFFGTGWEVEEMVSAIQQLSPAIVSRSQ